MILVITRLFIPVNFIVAQEKLRKRKNSYENEFPKQFVPTKNTECLLSLEQVIEFRS